MERNARKIGLVNLLVMLGLGVASYVLSRYANALSGQVGSIFFGLGFLVLAISYFQMRLEESERLEKLEFDELTRSRASASLFNASEEEVFPAKRSRQQFERFFVPGFTLLLLVLQVWGAYACWNWLKDPALVALTKPAVAMSLLALVALALFLLGKYSAGIARLEKDRLIRPGASYLLLGAYISFVVAASIAAVQMGFPRVDLYAARALTVVLAVGALENLVALILELYRPRTKTTSPRVLYDSRLIGLISQPEGIFTTAAHALDYQFGFKVSETWVYRFLEKALAWLILVQIAALMLSTCFVFISPGEQGVLERWGRRVTDRGVLQPGLHFKWPYPMDQVHRARTDRILEFTVGTIQKADEAAPNGRRTIIWTVAHDKEEIHFLIASRAAQTGSGAGESATSEQGAPVDLLTAGIPVQYRIKDILKWMYEYTNAGALLEKMAAREVTRYMVNVDMQKIMSVDRAKASQELRERIQARAESLGIEVVFAGLQDIHPPVKVAPKFDEVVGAIQEVEARIREAEGYAGSVVPKAKADGTRKVSEAEAYRARVVEGAQARASQFNNQMVAYQAAPSVYLQRAYLDAFSRGATNARKYVLPSNTAQDVISLNLEDKLRPDLMDVPIPAKK